VSTTQDARLRAAQDRLELAIAAHAKARAEDNRLKTPASKKARDAAVVELELAGRKLADLVRREFGV